MLGPNSSVTSAREGEELARKNPKRYSPSSGPEETMRCPPFDASARESSRSSILMPRSTIPATMAAKAGVIPRRVSSAIIATHATRRSVNTRALPLPSASRSEGPSGITFRSSQAFKMLVFTPAASAASARRKAGTSQLGSGTAPLWVERASVITERYICIFKLSRRVSPDFSQSHERNSTSVWGEGPVEQRGVAGTPGWAGKLKTPGSRRMLSYLMISADRLH